MAEQSYFKKTLREIKCHFQCIVFSLAKHVDFFLPAK